MCNKADKKRGKRFVELLECDRCLRGYHLDCLDPPLDTVPEVLSYWNSTLCKGAPFAFLTLEWCRASNSVFGLLSRMPSSHAT